MKTANIFGIHFVLKKTKQANGTAPVYMRIVVDAQRAEISMKQRVDPAQWNRSRGMARGNRKDIRELNAYLEQARSSVTGDYRELQLRRKRITAEVLKNRYLGEDDREHTLTALVDYHNTEFTGKLRPGTLKNYYTTARYLEKFIRKKFRVSDYALGEIDFSFVQSFENYLRRHRPTDHQRPMNHNGVMKHMERFQKLMGLAVKLQWIGSSPFAQYHVRFEKVQIDFLGEGELELIREKALLLPRLEWVRDLFVFACYTGLAYADLKALTRKSIYTGIDGEPWLTGRRKKTKEPFHVPLLYPALELIGKYRGQERSGQKDTLFPVLSNQKLNSYLKEIADLCGITKNLTFHVARHTFATTVTLLNGVPIESLSKMLGHTKLSTTQVYARVVQQKLSQDMAPLRAKLAPKRAVPSLKVV